MSLQDEIRARHKLWKSWKKSVGSEQCYSCSELWPCHAIRAADELDRREFFDKSYPFNPKPGDQAWDLKWELADGGELVVHMGREGYEAFHRMLLWESTDDAIAAALGDW